MKRLIFIFISGIISANIFAQSPEKMSYQAVVRNSSNQLVTNTAVGMKISILQGSANGTVVYSESQDPSTNANGLVTIEVGGGTVISGTFSSIDWSAGTYFIKTEIDPSGGTSYSISGTSQLLSVPYALYAKSAGEKQNLADVLAINNNGNSKQIKNIANPVDAQDAATKAYVDELKAKLEELQLYSGFVAKDIDGNVYKAVSIGSQIWMAENLKTTRYNNGDTIATTNPAILDISSESAPNYQWVYDTADSNLKTYGRLYTWYAAIDSRNVCPSGWHIPSNAEWTTLNSYLGISDAALKLKESGNTHWNSPNLGATNETDFSALPGGGRYDTGLFNNIRKTGYWWSNVEASPSTSGVWSMSYNSPGVQSGSGKKAMGFSIRCVKD
jgi:uncharacterized protein (TIGR02145 family)